MADENTTQAAVPPTGNVAAPVPVSNDRVMLYAKMAAAFLLGASVLALDVMDIKAPDYIALVVAPGLSMLGLHAAAKTLN
jgi:hypothetical protein